MSPWLNRNFQAIKLVLFRMRENRASSLMIILVIGIAMCLPSLFYIGVDNLSKFTHHMQDETEISLFLKLGSNSEVISNMNDNLTSNSEIKSFHFVSKDEAWQSLQAKSNSDNDIGKTIQKLSKNPLPDAFFIKAKSSDPEALEALRSELQNIQNVEQAILNKEWTKRLSSLIALAKKIIFLIISLIALALLVIIGNTIRMQILSQKDEIEVSNLIGASNSFIRLPFLYAGAFYGFFGGLIAIGFTAFIIKIFNYSIVQISDLYSNDFSLPLFKLDVSIALITIAVFIGWIGSYLATTQSIASIKIN